MGLIFFFHVSKICAKLANFSLSTTFGHMELNMSCDFYHNRVLKELCGTQTFGLKSGYYMQFHMNLSTGIQ